MDCVIAPKHVLPFSVETSALHMEGAYRTLMCFYCRCAAPSILGVCKYAESCVALQAGIVYVLACVLACVCACMKVCNGSTLVHG